MKSGIIAVLLLSTTIFAQDKPKTTPVAQIPVEATKQKVEEKTPELTPEQKSQITILLLQLDNAQKAAQIAQMQFDQVRKTASDVIVPLQLRNGYELDLQTLTYKKKG